MNIQPTIEFKERRCSECGTWWAIETFRNCDRLIECPWCAARKVEATNNRVAAIERSMSALKANFTRLKARKP